MSHIYPNSWIYPPQPDKYRVYPDPFKQYTPPVVYPKPYKPQLAESFKPKSAGSKTAHVVFVLDDSASMQSIRDLMITAFNEYLDGQKLGAGEKKVPTFVSLYKFDGTNVNCVFSRKPVDQVSHINRDNYNPLGMTNLYDAIGGVLMAVNNDLGKQKKANRDSVIIGVLTDGAENASNLFSITTVKQMIEKAEGKNWGFQFFGANIDAYALGATLGFRSENTMQFTGANIRATMMGATRMANDMKVAYSAGLNTASVYASTSFSDVEKKAAIDDDK